MVTKCDLVAGFTEYFDDLTQEARAQVWGVTFPYEQTLSGEAAADLPGGVRRADDAAERAGVRAASKRMRDVRRRTRRSSRFRSRWRRCATRSTQFVDRRLRVDARSTSQILLRGVYFTSGTQEGTPIDRLLGAHRPRASASRRSAVAPPPGRGKAYFVERLLKDVMIGESGLAGVNRRLEMRKAALQLGAYAVAGLVAVLGVAALSVSYSRNRDYLDAGRRRRSRRSNRRAPVDADVAARSDRRRASTRSAAWSIRGPVSRRRRRWPMRWGLYQGRSIGNSARDAYVRELDGILLPRFAAQLQAAARSSTAGEPEKLYAVLQGLPDARRPEHLDKAHLADARRSRVEAGRWRRGRGRAARLRSISQACSRMRRRCVRCRSIGDSGQRRRAAASRRRSIPRILYDGIKRGYADEAGQGLRVDQRAGLEVERYSGGRAACLSRCRCRRCTRARCSADHDGRPRRDFSRVLTRTPGSGAEQCVVARQRRSARRRGHQSLRDTTTSAPGTRSSTTCSSFRSTTVAQTNDALRILTSPTSPLRGLLSVIAEHTTLVRHRPRPPRAARSTRRRRRSKAIINPAQKALGLSTSPRARA